MARGENVTFCDRSVLRFMLYHPLLLSHYDGDELLSTASDFLCPTYVPEGQACALPLGPGVYGGGDPLTVGPIESIPDILLPFLKVTLLPFLK